MTLTGPAPKIPASEGHGVTAGGVDDDVIAALIDWLDGTRVHCLPATVVPGTTTEERKRLAALGGIVRSVARPQQALGPLPAGVRDWIDAAPTPPRDLADRVASTLRSRGAEFLAQIYERIVRGPHRRSLGTYFTPQATVDWMLAEWSAKEARPQSVVDVGAGVGVFTASALTAWRPGAIYAVDVNPVTLGLLAALCLAMEHPPRGVRMVLEDYTSWKGYAHLPSSCVTVGNPPYTRLQLLPKPTRARLKADLPDCGSRAGLSTWILASAFGRLRAQDGLLFLLPRNWMETDYGAGLRARLWNATHRRVELTCLSGDLFGEARVDAVALLVGAQKPVPQPFVLRESPDDLGSPIADRSGPAPSFVATEPRSVIGHVARAEPRVHADAGDTSPLSAFGTVRRGAATGANEYFALSDEALHEWKLPRSCVQPLVRRLRDFPRDTIAEADLSALGEHALRWLVLVRESQVDRGVAMSAYVEHGVEIGVADRHLCRQRTPWYDLHCDTTFPDVIVGAMSSNRFRFVENDARAAITNNLFGLTWAATVTREERASVLTWLRSDPGQHALRAACRVQAGGLRKLEPRALGAVRIPIIQRQQGEVPA